MDKTKIDWATASWNPITGCLHGCEYCFARGIARRFGKSKGAAHMLDKIFSEEFKEPLTEKMHELDNPVYYSGKVDPYPYAFNPTFHQYHLGGEETPTRLPFAPAVIHNTILHTEQLAVP